MKMNSLDTLPIFRNLSPLEFTHDIVETVVLETRKAYGMFEVIF